MKTKIIGILVVTLLIATALSAVGTMNKIKPKDRSLIGGPEIEWTKTYGGDEFDQFRCVKQTSDSGYIAFGEYEEMDMTYARMMKLDADGEEVWSVINYDINGSGYDEEELMNYVIQTTDGGYLAGGYHWYHWQGEFEGEPYDFWGVGCFLWKVDSDGDTEWLKYYYDLENLTYFCSAYMIEIEDGFMNAGWAVIILDPEFTEYVLDFVLFKTDLDGNLEWYKTYDGGGVFEWALSLYKTTDGGYFLAGQTYENDNVDERGIYIVKTDENGVKQWDNIIDGPKNDYCTVRGCCQAEDGGYVISGTTNSYGSGLWDNWVIKTDSSGDMEWNRTFGGKSNDHTWSMCKTSDGGYVLNIVTNYGGFVGTRDDILLVKLDDNGNVIWKTQYELDDRQIPTFIHETEDGGFVICGRDGTPDSSKTDSIVLKLASFENQRPNTPDKPSGNAKGEPGKDYTFTTSCTDPDGDDLLFLWDWGDDNFSEWLDTTSASHNWSEKGDYFVTVMAKDIHGGESDWSESHKISIPRPRSINRPLFNLFEDYAKLFTILKILLQRLGI